MSRGTGGPSSQTAPGTTLTPTPAPVDRPVAGRTRVDGLAARVRLLVAATITHDLVEAAVALAAGARASSTALVGFGLDSRIEVSSAAAVAWQLSARTAEGRQAWRGEGCCAPTSSRAGLGTPAGPLVGAAARCCGPDCRCSS